MKINRQEVYNKCGGHCGYCGKVILPKEMQVDHMTPICQGGGDGIDNLLPVCRQCNHYKRGESVEGFRVIMNGLERRLRDVYIYKVAANFGMVMCLSFGGTFYFERTKAEQ